MKLISDAVSSVRCLAALAHMKIVFSMKYSKYAFAFLCVLAHEVAYAQSIVDKNLQISIVSDSEILIRKSKFVRRCSIDEKPVAIKLSSDGQSVIVSGTSFVKIEDLMQCDSGKVVRAKRAAPHVGFLSDVNLRVGLYASLVPVSAHPMSFLAVVAKIGSDKNIIDLPGFYQSGMRVSQMLSEASSTMLPVISLDGRYLSLDAYSCESDKYIDVFDIASKRKTGVSHELCEEIFNFR
jgi:hypothetical protein